MQVLFWQGEILGKRTVAVNDTKNGAIFAVGRLCLSNILLVEDAHRLKPLALLALRPQGKDSKHKSLLSYSFVCVPAGAPRLEASGHIARYFYRMHDR